MTRPIPTLELIDRLLDIIEFDILPLTQQGISQGNKLFGAALLYKKDHALVLAQTNNEMESPLMHGEMHALKHYHAMPESERPAPSELIFLSTHEPCSLCMSAITWSGFDNFFYLFSHEDSRDAFAIPHDLKILKEVFNVEPGGYQKSNAFWDSYGIQEFVKGLPENQLAPRRERIERISVAYNGLSDVYQSSKSDNNIPLN